MVRRVIRPLETLRRGAELIGSGNLGHRIEIKTGDELEVLAEEFNKMTEATVEIDWSELKQYESEDNTEGSQTLACTGASCEI